MIDLGFNETQKLISSSARDFFERECSLNFVREIEGSDERFSAKLWKQMAELGWLGITFPEQYGGSGGTFLDLYALHEEIGRALLPGPHLETVAVAGETILAAGTDEQRQRILPAIASGNTIVTPALTESNGAYGPTGINLAAAQQGDGFVLNGTKLLVPYANVADYILVVARTRGENTPDGISLFLLDAKTAGLTITPLENIAGYALSELTFSDVRAPADSLVGPLHGGWEPLSTVLTRAGVLQCGQIVGAGFRVLDMTADYARDRVQFGRPIGTFQAVQYLVTDIAIDTELTRMLTVQALWRIDQGLPYEKEASVAKAYASKAVAHLTRQSHEVHAGVAFMIEHDLHFFTRRAVNWEMSFGDNAYHHEQIAVALGI